MLHPAVFLCVLCSLMMSSLGAPVLTRNVRKERNIVHTKINDIGEISWKKVPPNKTGTTSIVLELNNNSDDVISIEDFFAQKDTKSYNKKSRDRRHVISADGIAEEILPSNRNKRSTAAAMLSAMINLCDKHKSLCQSIKVRDKDVRTTIRLETM